MCVHSTLDIYGGLVPGCPRIPKSADAEVPNIIFIVFAYNLYTSPHIL
jgi:hypothetical protein